MKKIIGVISLFLVILAGCGNSDEDTATMVEQEVGDEIVVRLPWTDNANDDSDYMNFTREHTGANYHMEMSPLDSGEDKLAMDLAGEMQLNLVKVQPYQFEELLANGIPLDLKPYLEEYGQNILDKVSDEAWETVTDPETGAIYGIPSFSINSNVDQVTFMRADIMEKEGLETPTNTDEIVSTVCTLADRGYATPWAINWSSAVNEFGVREAFGVGNDWNVNGDDIEYIGNDPRYLDFLKMMNQIYECGGFGSDYETITQEDHYQRFTTGESVFMTDDWWNVTQVADGFTEQGLDWRDSIEFLVDFTGPEGIKGAYQSGGGVTNVTFIPNYMEKYAQQTIEFVNKMYEDDYILQAYFGEEGVNFAYEGDMPYLLPSGPAVWDGAGFDYYSTGIPDTILRESDDLHNEEVEKLVDSGAEVDDLSYGLVMANQYKDIGVQDPLASAMTIDKWNAASECANGKVKDFSNMYITGRKTDDDIEEFSTDLYATCPLDEASVQVKDWHSENK